MADATEQGDVVITEASEDAKQVAQTEADASSTTDWEAQAKNLQAELEKVNGYLEKSRRGEKYAKQSRQELEAKLADYEKQGDYKALYEQMVERDNARVLDGALSEALKDAAKPDSIKAALKLIDRSALKVKDGQVDAKAVEAAVLKAREEFPSLFVEVQTPAPKRAAEGAVTAGFEQELAAAKTQAEYNAVLKRHGLI